MKILGTGLSGLVGSRIVELLGNKYSFANISLETGVDITDYASVDRIISSSDAPWVFHFAAKTDVDGCEKDKPQGIHGAAWKINVDATENIVRLCRIYGKRLLYLATDYDFSGTKRGYMDSDMPDPLGWYGITKAEGEKRVLSLKNDGLVLRIANPYRAQTDSGKTDFVHKIKSRLESGMQVTAPTDSIFTPTFIDDIAYAIDCCVHKSASGIMNCAGADSMSPYTSALMIARMWGVDEQLVKKSDFQSYISERAPRPLHAKLINAKIFHYGISMKTFAQGLEEIKKQEDEL